MRRIAVVRLGGDVDDRELGSVHAGGHRELAAVTDEHAEGACQRISDPTDVW